MKVELTREEIGQALVEFAARKMNVSGTIKHHVQINGSWMVLGDEPPVVVTLEPIHMAHGGKG